MNDDEVIAKVDGSEIKPIPEPIETIPVKRIRRGNPNMVKGKVFNPFGRRGTPKLNE